MRHFLSALAIACLFTSCTKQIQDLVDGETDCPKSIELTATSLTPGEGDDITITAKPENGSYDWIGPAGSGVAEHYSTNTLTISDVKIKNSGWYYGTLVSSGCGVVVDSVFVDVQYKQGTPSCSLTGNTISGTGLPDLKASYVDKSFDASWNCMSLYASGSYGYPTYTILFNSSIGHNEPKDGIYTTTNKPVFGGEDDENTVFISCKYGMYYFQSHPDQTVYVSHVNGKLRVSFCSVKMGGDPGNSVITISDFAGQVTEQ